MTPCVTPTVASSRVVAKTVDARSSARQGDSGFAALVDPGDADADGSSPVSTADSSTAAGRQDEAATGKAPPADMVSAADASWLATILQGSTPGTMPVPSAKAPIVTPAAAPASSVTAALIVVPQADAPPSPRLAPPPPALDATAPLSTKALAASFTNSSLPTITGDTVPARTSALPTPSPTTVRDLESRPAQTPAAPQPVGLSEIAPPRAAVTIAPASEVFAEAIRAVSRQSDDTRDSVGSMLATPSLAGSANAMVGAIAASADRGEASLDMRHDNWPSTMIDHIEKLRDGADATNTRIRLVPDALGGIDVSLHRRDSGVQVTLRADQASTQAMLTQARPQLDALAEARGIRLADAGIGGGGSDPSASNGQRRPPAAMVPAAPVSVATIDDDLITTDRRVA